MAQRRARRRRKKEITAPKAHDAEIVSDVEELERSNPCKEKTAKRNKEKVPVGLALMHGFNASNVGKQRLTVCIHMSVLFLSLLSSSDWTDGSRWRFQQRSCFSEDKSGQEAKIER